MEQHPVPSHIASFEFKLFGNLTIRQFVTLAIPASVGGLIFFSGLPDILRFPLSALFVGFGLLIALVPFGGRPFHKWIMAFFKAILSPTQRIWIKEAKIPEFLWVITNPAPAGPQEVQNIDEKSKEKLEAYLASLPKSKKATALDVSEQIALENLHLDWHGKAEEGKIPAAIVWPSDSDLSPKHRAFADSLPQISQYADIELPKKARPSYQKKPGLLPRVSTHAKPYILGGIEARLRGNAPAIPIGLKNQNIKPKSHLASETNFATENIIPIVTPDMHIKLLHGIGKIRVRKLHFAPPLGFDLSKLPIRGEKQFDISRELKNRFHLSRDVLYQNPQVGLPQETQKAQVKTQNTVSGTIHTQDSNPRRRYHESSVVQPKVVHLGKYPVQQKPDVRDSLLATNFQQTSSQPQAILAQMAQMVPLTSKSNVISGIVLSSQNTPLEGAILIIRNETGVPVRALKSNRLGQFLSATSLPNGSYQIEIDAEGEDFEPVALILNNEVLQPIEIKAKGRADA